MRRMIPGIMLLVATVAIGCNSSTSSPNSGGGGSKADMIVGEWIMEKDNGKEMKDLEVVMEFKKDGTMTVMGMEGTWKVDGDKLTTAKKGSKDPKDSDTAVIKTLTADKMVLSDEGKKKGDTELKRKK